jgi:hypothetical protein
MKRGALSGIAQHLQQTADAFLQRQFVIDERVPWPDAFAQFFARHDFLGMFQQDLQHLEGLACELLLYAGLANLPSLQVNFENPELYYPRLAGHGDHRATLVGLNAAYHGSAVASISTENLPELDMENQQLAMEPTNHRQGS